MFFGGGVEAALGLAERGEIPEIPERSEVPEVPERPEIAEVAERPEEVARTPSASRRVVRFRIG